LQGWIVVTEPGPNLLQGIPWKRKWCKGLRDRVLSIGLQRQHPLGNAITKGETTTSHQGAHPKTGLCFCRGVMRAGVVHKFL